jgi:conjugative relaxase-like TrwC/TraI family protein
VLTIAPISSAQYYLGQALDALDEYYTKGEAGGRWLGKGAEALGLSGAVEAEDLRAVLQALSPADGGALVSGAASARRSRMGFDLVFSAPKGVSLIGLLGDRAVTEAVLDAHTNAVAQALGYLETEAAFVRRGRDGSVRLAAKGLVAASFVHTTSRLGDPQLHSHVLLTNLGESGDGAWSALDARAIYHSSRTAGFLYQAALRAELTRSLGMAWRPVVRGMAEPAGVPDKALEHFSRRRAEIEAALERLGESSAEAANIAAHATRAPKDHEVSREALVASWRLRAEQVGLGRNALRALTPVGHEPALAPLADLTDRLFGPEGLTHHASTFGRQEVLRALAESAHEGAEVAPLRLLASRLLEDERVVRLQAERSEGRYTTAELLATEQALVTSALQSQGAGRAVVPEPALRRVLDDRPGLADEQVAALEHLVRGGNGITALVGPAGTGKTFVLEAARAAWEAAGHRVVGTALAGRTALALSEATGAPSFTLARLLADAEQGGLPVGGVVLVDEAAMVGTRQLSKLWSAAERAGAKVVLVGDHHQVPEVEAGGAFKALVGALGAPELTHNRRQAEAWEREALAQLRSGSPARAVGAYAGHGRVITADSAPEARRAMVADWWAAAQEGHDAVMFALRRSDVDSLNRLARALARDAGQLAGPELEAGDRSFAVGDEVMALRADRRAGVLNGTRARVTGVDLAGGSLTVLTRRGEELALPAEYLEAGHLGWGYAVTLHKGQGSTVDKAFLLGSDGLYREAGYTGMSRGRVSNDVYLVGAASLEPGCRAPALAQGKEPLDRLVDSLGRSRAQALALGRLPGRLAATPSAAGDIGHEPHQLELALADRVADEGRNAGLGLPAEASRTPPQAPTESPWQAAARRLAERVRERESGRGIGQDIC